MKSPSSQICIDLCQVDKNTTSIFIFLAFLAQNPSRIMTNVTVPRGICSHACLGLYSKHLKKFFTLEDS